MGNCFYTRDLLHVRCHYVPLPFFYQFVWCESKSSDWLKLLGEIWKLNDVFVGGTAISKHRTWMMERGGAEKCSISFDLKFAFRCWPEQQCQRDLLIWCFDIDRWGKVFVVPRAELRRCQFSLYKLPIPASKNYDFCIRIQFVLFCNLNKHDSRVGTCAGVE